MLDRGLWGWSGWVGRRLRSGNGTCPRPEVVGGCDQCDVVFVCDELANRRSTAVSVFAACPAFLVTLGVKLLPVFAALENVLADSHGQRCHGHIEQNWLVGQRSDESVAASAVSHKHQHGFRLFVRLVLISIVMSMSLLRAILVSVPV